MKYHIALKFLAILLCTLSLLAAVGSAVAVYGLDNLGLYNMTIDEFIRVHTEYDCNNAAAIIASRYASKTLGNCPEALLESYFSESRFYTYSTNEGPWYYTLKDANGKILESNYEGQEDFQIREFSMECQYIAVIEDMELTDGLTALSEASDEETPDTSYDEETVSYDEALYYSSFEYYDPDLDDSCYVDLAYYESPRYLITLYVTADSFVPYPYMDVVELMWANRYNVIILLAVSLLFFAIGIVYLCCAAGRKQGNDEVQPAGLNCLPLDLYVVCGGILCALLSAGIINLQYYRIFQNDTVNLGPITLAVLCAVGISLIIVAFLYACAAQFKARGGYWWRHSVIGWLLRLIVKAWNVFWKGMMKTCRWFRNTFPPFVKRIARKSGAICKNLWAAFVKAGKGCYALLARCFSWLGRNVKRFFGLLPLTWQWLLTAFVMVVALYLAFNVYCYSAGFVLLVLCACTAIVLYGTNAFGTLLENTKRMSQGNLNTKVDKKALIGCFDEFAEDLNALADVTVVAAQKQMKSEHMKAELITNVSHDIKTPLTSIINYVDLLQKAHSQEEAEQYLEVLARQAQRMKKLIEDLMEMSKATTGNLPVDIRVLDAAETVNQSLGEFADKLTDARLTPVFSQPESPIYILADGRLAWRVLSNLLSNAVKYALEGTRLYIDLVEMEGKVLISLKNISREQLNVSSDELMERFVRGDASRNTEGSGLGLNIAKSLMELQHGQLQLLVDGDLFKVTLVFPSTKVSDVVHGMDS